MQDKLDHRIVRPFGRQGPAYRLHRQSFVIYRLFLFSSWPVAIALLIFSLIFGEDISIALSLLALCVVGQLLLAARGILVVDNDHGEPTTGVRAHLAINGALILVIVSPVVLFFIFKGVHNAKMIVSIFIAACVLSVLSIFWISITEGPILVRKFPILRSKWIRLLLFGILFGSTIVARYSLGG